MPEFTKEQLKKYLDSGGSNCPFCESDNIEAMGKHDWLGDTYHQKVECHSCGRSWWEDFTLTGAHYEEGDDKPNLDLVGEEENEEEVPKE